MSDRIQQTTAWDGYLTLYYSPTGDFGYYVFGKSRAAYVFSAFMLLANNILLIGFHVLTGAKVLNTLSDHSLCTAVFAIIATIMGIVMSVPRTLNHVSSMSMISCESESYSFIRNFHNNLLMTYSRLHGNFHYPLPRFRRN